MRHIGMLVLALASCTDDEDPPGGVNPFGPEITTIALEVDYAEGAEPYTGDIIAFGEVWNVAETNARALLGDKQYEFPHDLDEMQAISDAGSGDYSSDDILAIAEAHRDRQSEGGTAAFYVVWLDGYYEVDGERQDTVLGVSIGDTEVVGMFKPVIESSGAGPGLNVEKYVEQATLVHELGHAVGLVNNGLPMASPHQDEAHGAHCNNEDCIMYFAVEGVSGAVGFVQEALTSDEVVLFADDCLADGAAAR